MRFSLPMKRRSSRKPSGAGAGGDEGGQRRRIGQAGARAQHHHHPDEADSDRGPAPPADGFAEDRHRQGGDQQGRAEQDGVDIGDRHPRIGVEAGEGPGQPDRRPRRMQPGAAGPELAEAAGRPGIGQHRHQAEGGVEENHLIERIAGGQPFDRGVHAGEQGEAETGEADPRRDGGVGRGEGEGHGGAAG